MSLDLGAVGRQVGPAVVEWSSTDAILYALGVGAGQLDPAAERELTTENSNGVTQQILPTFAIVLSQRAGLAVDIGQVDRAKVVHGEQKLTLHQPLSVEGSASLTARVSGIFDKGSGALIRTTIDAVDPASGAPLFTSEGASFLRGAGGFGGPKEAPADWPEPHREPDVSVAVPTRTDQALLYRLSGDRNPLHSDPVLATRAGFDRPILHGLCTFGITARAALQALQVDPGALASISGRFTKPVLPGETFTVSLWKDGDRTIYRTADGDGDAVLDRGVLTTR
ncbi:MaoC/PaaZ C-terminal domain-containing protein [Rhodococcus artemisiae]|uniref:MaoC/PaaZ C-terminal domain-containing protein n=1 Tax=Rhodococcus artemisiae TaxID=714159 RepID=A0ABU7LCY2_9NOCA|nr:MaoC/PaaZ C-terminal domain-containing protein [Rhodococcus artemisiae]MEE2059122.1 MaoC/PaaZ C-terminal domain-containing protein [Rhodococcus artemisiae]